MTSHISLEKHAQMSPICRNILLTRGIAGGQIPYPDIASHLPIRRIGPSRRDGGAGAGEECGKFIHFV